MSIKIDLTGERYGKLEVLRLEVDEPGKKKKWLCKCDCGAEVIVSASNLRNAHTRSCTQCGYKSMKEKNKKHGASKELVYGVWQAMRSRCERENVKSYLDYGARGITVCEEWHDPSKFIAWAMENGYEPGMEIDRIDTNKNYCPENCRWVSRLENANNKRNNKIIEYNGERKTLAEWARHFDVKYKNLSRNINKGYSLEEAVKRDKTGERTHRGSKNWIKNRG